VFGYRQRGNKNDDQKWPYFHFPFAFRFNFLWMYSLVLSLRTQVPTLAAGLPSHMSGNLMTENGLTPYVSPKETRKEHLSAGNLHILSMQFHSLLLAYLDAWERNSTLVTADRWQSCSANH
jgi:hypothetical protein